MASKLWEYGWSKLRRLLRTSDVRFRIEGLEVCFNVYPGVASTDTGANSQTLKPSI